MDHMDFEKRKELRRLFLTLWDKAVGTPKYDKHQWTELEYLIELLVSPPITASMPPRPVTTSLVPKPPPDTASSEAVTVVDIHRNRAH